MSSEESAAAAAASPVLAEAKEVTFAAFMPHLKVPDNRAAEALAFYKAAFGAKQVSRYHHTKRKADKDVRLVLLAEIDIGGSIVLVSDQIYEAAEEAGSGNSPGNILFYLETSDVDAAVEQAVKAGATVEMPPVEDNGPIGKVKDPFGYVWVINSLHVTKPADESEDGSGGTENGAAATDGAESEWCLG